MENDRPILYHVDKEYLKYLHAVDYRVSVKYNTRPFAGVVTIIEDKKYIIPLTSQTTEVRNKMGRKKRSHHITTFVKLTSGKEISNLLYNNMIPITENLITAVDINPRTDTYESNEIRYLRKNWKDIKIKASNVYKKRYDDSSKDFKFYEQTCCDFKKLEVALEGYMNKAE